MTYEQAIGFLNGFTKSGKPATDLIRFIILMRCLGNPHHSLCVVHVAGTNGKGSVCEYISNTLQAWGKNVGKFTSPYIDCVEERIQVNGRYISKPAFALMCSQVERAVEQSGFDGYSQFEILCAIALLYFSKEKVGCAVIETGIGGTFDCTNILYPILSVITTIDYDHTDILGDTLTEIAGHKAGIIKPNTPCFVSPCQPPEALEVIETRCREFNSKLTVPDMSRVQKVHMDLGDLFISYKGMNFHSLMTGEHQIANILCAIEVCEHMGVDYGRIYTGIERSVLPARLEHIVKDNTEYIIDGSHNPSAMRAAAKLLAAVGRKKYAVIGMMSNKDWQASLDEIMGSFEEIIFVDSFAQGAVPMLKLAGYAESKGCRCSCEASVENALKQLKERSADGIAMVTGSLYLASEARKLINPQVI